MYTLMKGFNRKQADDGKSNVDNSSLNERYLDEREVGSITGVALSTLRRWRSQKRGIRFVKLNKSVRYRRSDVVGFMNRHLVETEDVDV